LREVIRLNGALSTGSVAGPATLAGVARKLIAMVPQVPAVAVGVTQSETESCTGGGSISLTVSAAGTSGVVTGDSITATAANCVEIIDGLTRSINGKLGLSVSAGSFDPASVSFPKDVTLHMTAENLSLDNVSLNGTLDLHLVQTNSVAGAVTVSAPTFTWKVSGAAPRTLTLKNYTQRVAQSTVDTASITVTGTVESDNPHYGGGTVSYDITTPQPVVVNTLNDDMLVSGAMKVTGKDSALLMTDTANNTLQLQVDTNGDGTYDTTQTVSRFALVP